MGKRVLILSASVGSGHVKAADALARAMRERPDVEEVLCDNSSGDSIIYRSGMNPKIGRNFEVLSPCDFIARITRHIPDKSFQLVRYYGWYSNKMRGQRLKRAVKGG